VNLKEFLQEHNIPTAPEGHDHYRPGWINFDCPMCSKDWKHYRLGYNQQYGYLNCWQCGNMRLYDVLINTIPDIDRKELGDFVRGIDYVAVRQIKKQGKLILPTGLGGLQDCHKDYLRARGFNWRELKRLWQIRGTGVFSQSSQGTDLKFRIFIPIHYRGEVVSWTTRSIGDKHERRYISASSDEESFAHKGLLYGADYVRHAAIICEGPTDVWRIGPGSVCTFGTSYSSAQLEQLSRYPVRVVCSDRERAAQRKAKELCRLLSVFPGYTFNVELSAKDPGEATKHEIQKLRRKFLGD
jgi:hypothetical protein